MRHKIALLRLISNLCWIVSGLGIAGALVWITLAQDKGNAILGGLVADAGAGRVWLASAFSLSLYCDVYFLTKRDVNKTNSILS